MDPFHLFRHYTTFRIAKLAVNPETLELSITVSNTGAVASDFVAMVSNVDKNIFGPFL